MNAEEMIEIAQRVQALAREAKKNTNGEFTDLRKATAPYLDELHRAIGKLLCKPTIVERQG